MIDAAFVDYRPRRDVQLETLNRALNDEILRHTRSRLLNLHLMSLLANRPYSDGAIRERVVVREKVVDRIVVVERTVRPTRPERKPRDLSLRPKGSTIPVEMAQRSGLAAVIDKPIRLRSGVVIDPERVAAMRDNKIAIFGDSSWLVLCALAERGDHVSSADLNTRMFFGKAASSTIRTSIERARQVIKHVGGRADDIEVAGRTGGGWMLILAEDAQS